MVNKVGLAYRSEIDGLRAIAIIAVLLFHANFGVTGGYVGVDVFFVISGFLITSLILSDLNQGRFSFIQFWERRARRIAPAMIVLVFAVLVSGWFILFPIEFRNLGRAIVFLSLFIANIFTYMDSSYFGGASANNPLLHTWSLAVEEQFYLLMPLLLLILFRYKKTKPKRSIVLLLSLMAIGSFVISALGANLYPSAAFYLLPSRAWELLVGSVLVVIPEGIFTPKKRAVREILSLGGLSCIVCSSLFYSDKTVFPGVAALLPVLGTALIIHSNRRRETEDVDTWVGELLSLKPIVFIGLISYSLYLWHWPFIVMSQQISVGPPDTVSRLATVALSFVAAVTSWKFVETPFRLKKIGKGTKIFVWAGIGLFVLAILGLCIYLLGGVRQRYSEQFYSYYESINDKSFRIDLSLEDAKQGNFYRIGNPDTRRRPTVLVWGDSHAKAAMEAFAHYLRSRNLSGVGATHSSTVPVLNWYQTSPWGLNAQSPEYNQAVVDYILKNRIKYVFLVSYWESNINCPPVNGKTFESALVETVEVLKSEGVQVYLMLDVPRTTLNVPRLLARTYINGWDYRDYLSNPHNIDHNDRLDSNLLKKIHESGTIVLNPKDAFLSESGDYYVIEKSGQALYIDDHHLSTKGALLVYLPFLEHSLEGALLY